MRFVHCARCGLPCRANQLAIPFQRVEALPHVDIPRIAIREHLPDGTTGRTDEVAEQPGNQGPGFAALIGGTFLGEDGDGA